MSFFFWFPVGILAGVSLGILALVYDFRGVRSMLEDDVKSGMDDIDVWGAFQARGPHGDKTRDYERFEELMQRTQLWVALVCVLMGILALVGPW
jgi:hypothetical protein